jgi:putative restriction endonuclease
MVDSIGDTLLRTAAFERVRTLCEIHDHLTAQQLGEGFIVDGQRYALVNPRRGIFKPARMRFLLSINTVFPKTGNRVWYDDQRDVHRQIFDGDQMVDYAFMGDNPDSADNRWLREAFENQIPIIYFLGIAPGRYQAILPAFIGGWDRSSKRARIAFGLPGQNSLTPPATEIERRYALRTIKHVFIRRLFEKQLRCALSGFPSPCFSTPLISSKINTKCLVSLWSATASRSRKSITRPSTLISSESTRISDCMFQSVCSFNMTVQC